MRHEAQFSIDVVVDGVVVHQERNSENHERRSSLGDQELALGTILACTDVLDVVSGLDSQPGAIEQKVELREGRVALSVDLAVGDARARFVDPGEAGLLEDLCHDGLVEVRGELDRLRGGVEDGVDGATVHELGAHVRDAVAVTNIVERDSVTRAGPEQIVIEGYLCHGLRVLHCLLNRRAEMHRA